jgi:flagellar M-ring protein FliF
MYVIELGVMMLLGLVVLFMVIRPLVKRILTSEQMAQPTADGSTPFLTDGSAQPGGAPGISLIPGINATAQAIDVAEVQGQVHAQSVHRVGELAERNPNETANIVRQWLAEQPA